MVRAVLQVQKLWRVLTHSHTSTLSAISGPSEACMSVYSSKGCWCSQRVSTWFTLGEKKMSYHQHPETKVYRENEWKAPTQIRNVFILKRGKGPLLCHIGFLVWWGTSEVHRNMAQEFLTTAENLKYLEALEHTWTSQDCSKDSRCLFRTQNSPAGWLDFSRSFTRIISVLNVLSAALSASDCPQDPRMGATVWQLWSPWESRCSNGLMTAKKHQKTWLNPTYPMESPMTSIETWQFTLNFYSNGINATPRWWTKCDIALFGAVDDNYRPWCYSCWYWKNMWEIDENCGFV